MYDWLFQKYKQNLQPWTTQKELTAQLKEAYLDEAGKLLRSTGQTQPPFDPVVGLQAQNVHDIMDRDALREEAKLVPDELGFILFLRGTHQSYDGDNKELRFVSRLRTTLAHELGHTFFYDTSTKPPRLPVSSVSRLLDHQLGEKEEWWCMDFARAYLVPDFWVEGHVKHGDLPSLQVALDLKNELKVSWDILFRRLLWDLKVWHNCIVFRLDLSTMCPQTVWKAGEFKHWSFRNWFNSGGKHAIAKEVSATGLSSERTVRILFDRKKVVNLRILKTEKSIIATGALCRLERPQVSDTLGTGLTGYA
jgi:hypothetical protein